MGGDMSDYPNRRLSDPVKLRQTRLPNRIVRAATYEGMADTLGAPQQGLVALYSELLSAGCGTLITGAMFVHEDGRLPWPHQCAADSPEAFTFWESILDQLHRLAPEAIVVAQLCHGGALSCPLGQSRPFGPSPLKLIGQPSSEATAEQIENVIEAFARGARLAYDAGFDAVQIHAADGYLFHQFLSLETNHRADIWGQPSKLLLAVLARIRETTSPDLPVWVKLPWMDDDTNGIRQGQTRSTVQYLEEAGVELCEITYGSMTRPTSTVRGYANPREWREAHPSLGSMPSSKRSVWALSKTGRNFSSRDFTPNYNARAANQLQAQCASMAIMATGGIHTLDDAHFCINDLGLPAIGLSRALIHNPRLAELWLADAPAPRSCTHCNRCLLTAYSHSPLACTGDI